MHQVLVHCSHCVCRLEALPEVTQKMLRCCTELLGVVRTEGGGVRLEYAQLILKMMVMNIFAFHHAADTYAGECVCVCACVGGAKNIVHFACVVKNDASAKKYSCGALQASE